MVFVGEFGGDLTATAEPSVFVQSLNSVICTILSMECRMNLLNVFCCGIPVDSDQSNGFRCALVRYGFRVIVLSSLLVRRLWTLFFIEISHITSHLIRIPPSTPRVEALA
eukprot:scaffold218550_cov20-Prasinocladus_malaysianus.AAC.1